MRFCVYDIKGNYLGEHNIKTFTTLVRKTQSATKSNNNAITVKEDRLRNAMLGDKGYGYYLGFFVSHRPVKIMSRAEEKAFTDNYINRSYTRLQNFFSAMLEWDEDIFSDVVMYLYEQVLTDRGVNRLEYTIKFKYYMMLKDAGNIKNNENKFIIGDFYIEDEDCNDESFIETTTESATLSHIDRSCNQEVNDIHLIEAIKDRLYSVFKEEDVDMYLDYITKYKNTKGLGIRKMAVDYKVCVTTIVKKTRAITKYLDGNKNNIVDQASDYFYPELDDITLKNIIHD